MISLVETCCCGNFRRAGWVLGLLFAFAVLAPAALQATHVLGTAQAANFPFGPGGGDVVFNDPGAKFLILRVTAGPGSAGDHVEVELGYDTDRFNLAPGQQFWTRPIGGTSATLRYLDNGNGVGNATVDRYGKGTIIDLFQLSDPFANPVFSPNGICGGGAPSWQSVECLSAADPEENLMKTVARSVGMFVMVHDDEVSSCSAALINPDLLLTAAHCVDDPEIVESGSFTLDYLTDCTDHRPVPYNPKFFKLTRIVRSGFEDPPAGELDYAVLQVNTGVTGLGVPPLTIRPTPPAVGDELFAIHHPRGVPKKVSRQPLDPSCSVGATSSSSILRFGCDLDNGSSGSPLFDISGRIVGVNDWASTCTNGAQTATVIRPDFIVPVPPPVDVNVVTVFDRSGSMSLTGLSGTTKLAEAKEATGLFIDLLRTTATHQAGLVSFSTTPADDSFLSPVTAGSKGALVGSPPGTGGTVGGLTAGGNTTIGGGLRRGRQQIAGVGGSNTPAILLMTDGLQNTAPMIAEVEPELGPTRLCAVGFGTEASLDGPLLTRLAREHGGIYTRAGEGLDLKKFFAFCFGNIFESGISMDPPHVFPEGSYSAAPISLPVCGEQSLTVVLGWENRTSRLFLELETPGGATLSAATAGVTASTGTTWAFLRLPLPFNGERDGTWKIKVGRPRGAGEFPAPAPRERFFVTSVIQGGPRLRPATQPPLYTGDPLDPRVILRDPRGFSYDGTVEVTVVRPTQGTGNILTQTGLGRPITINGDVIDARASTLISLEQSRGGELVGTASATFPLFDDDEHGERAMEPDGQFGDELPELTRHEGNYTFHARARFGDGCTATREAFWTSYVAVGIDPGQTTVTGEPTGDLPGGRVGVRVHFTPRDRYGNFVGPGRGDSFDVEAPPGSTIVGGVRDLGDGSYEVDISWDPSSGHPPGAVVSQPGRPAVGLPVPVPPGFAGGHGMGLGLAFGSALPVGGSNERLDSGFAARITSRWPVSSRFSLIGGLGYAGFNGAVAADDLGLWDLTIGGRWDSVPAPPVRFFAEGGAGFYLPETDETDESFGLYLGVGISVPLIPSRLDLELGFQGHKLLGGDDDNPDFLRALIGLEVRR